MAKHVPIGYKKTDQKKASHADNGVDQTRLSPGTPETPPTKVGAGAKDADAKGKAPLPPAGRVPGTVSKNTRGR